MSDDVVCRGPFILPVSSEVLADMEAGASAMRWVWEPWLLPHANPFPELVLFPRLARWQARLAGPRTGQRRRGPPVLKVRRVSEAELLWFVLGILTGLLLYRLVLR